MCIPQCNVTTPHPILYNDLTQPPSPNPHPSPTPPITTPACARVSGAQALPPPLEREHWYALSRPALYGRPQIILDPTKPPVQVAQGCFGGGRVVSP